MAELTPDQRLRRRAEFIQLTAAALNGLVANRGCPNSQKNLEDMAAQATRFAIAAHGEIDKIEAFSVGDF